MAKAKHCNGLCSQEILSHFGRELGGMCPKVCLGLAGLLGGTMRQVPPGVRHKSVTQCRERQLCFKCLVYKFLGWHTFRNTPIGLWKMCNLGDWLRWHSSVPNILWNPVWLLPTAALGHNSAIYGTQFGRLATPKKGMTQLPVHGLHRR
jgi:hypothetical protein